jgi:GNAT superfamily N-acetyltransferase
VIADEITEVVWARLHDPRESMGVLGAYVGGKLCGIVHYIFHRSCWTIGDYCYLQDLFVADGVRNRGLGRALIAAVEEKARTAGASRVYWLTHETNTDARALYDKLADRSGFIQYRKLF